MAAGKRGIEAGRAYVKAYLDSSLLMRGLKGIKSQLASVGRSFAKIGAVGLGAGLVAAAVGLRQVFKSISETAEIDKIAKSFGLATEKASGLFGVFRASGSENARENIESLVTLSGRVNDALSGTGEQAGKLFDGLSVSAEELSKLSIDEQFFRMHEAIRELPDPLDQINRLMLAFGEDGGKTLIGTLSKSTEELRKQAGALALSKEDAEAASKAQMAMNRASAAFDRVWVKISTVVAPIIENIANGLEHTANLISNGGLQEGLDWLAKKFDWLAQWVKDSFKVIKDAIAAGEFSAAAKVAAASFRLAFAQAIDWVKGAWLDLKTGMASVFIELSAQVESIWSSLVAKMTLMAGNAIARTFEMLSRAAMAAGQEELAGGFGQVGLEATRNAIKAGNTDEKTQAEIEKRRQQMQETLAEDAAREREAISSGVTDAANELATAMEEAKGLADAAAIRDLDEGVKKGAIKSVKSGKDAVNTAAIVASSAGQEAFLKATMGFGKNPTVGEKLIAGKLDKVVEAVGDLAGEVVLAEGDTI